MSIECPIESLRTCLACDYRDWSLDKSDAWIYGIVFGWDDAMQEVGDLHHWTPGAIKRLKRLHAKFMELGGLPNDEEDE